MATSLLLLLDDIASVLDDVATMTKVAATKTAGVVGDDLAVNAKQVAGVRPDREFIVVWRVALGSALNKAILVPLALLISWFVPGAIPPLLVAGGVYLCYEGAEKLLHTIRHRRKSGRESTDILVNTGHLPAIETKKIRGAIRTDFILSAEIIVITLGVVAGKAVATQVGVLVAVAILMTVGVYGLVAAIVKIDDLGLWLTGRTSRWIQGIGRLLLLVAPWLMHGLSVAGTAAMFLVGGGIVVHQVPAVHHAIDGLVTSRPLGGEVGALPGLVVGKFVEALVGLGLGLGVAGILAVAGIFRSLYRFRRDFFAERE